MLIVLLISSGGKMKDQGEKGIRAGVVSISAENDELVGQTISEAIDKVGPEGVLSNEFSSSFETTVEVEEGMEIDRGHTFFQFVTNLEKLIIGFENVRVLITNLKSSTIKDIIPLLEKRAQVRPPLLVIVEEVTGEPLATLVVSKLQGILHVATINALGFGEHRKPLLQDLAILAVEQFGIACKVTISKNSTTSIVDAASKDELRARIAQHELQTTTLFNGRGNFGVDNDQLVARGKNLFDGTIRGSITMKQFPLMHFK
ncbi:hypothetical protein Ahy_A07g034851 [Arachis hypogaea]|uniref:Uncharacterized protein n=2 Tax=Arachis TaxID=3817 RepID=A0A445CCV5_ARAHY|nr:hypothetical protein Ahy_A07g034851 [Arachis hypogaea]